MKRGEKVIHVIQHGNMKKVNTRCISCGCVFEAVEIDFKTVGRLDDEIGAFKYLKCPTAGQILFFKTEDLREKFDRHTRKDLVPVFVDALRGDCKRQEGSYES